MPSLVRLAAGVLAAAALAYSVVVVQQVLVGVLVASVVVLLGVLVDGHLGALRPARTTAGTAAVVAVCALVLAYSLLVAQEVLLGLLVAGTVWAAGVFLRRVGGRTTLLGAVSPGRLAAGLLAAGVVLGYALVVAQQLLLGVLAGLALLGAVVATGVVR